MSRKRTLFFVLAAAAITVVVVLGVLVTVVGPQAIKARVEERLARATGLQAKISGDVELHLLPPLGASFTELAIRRDGQPILTVKRFTARVALWSLLQRELRLTRLVLEAPVLTLRPGGVPAHFGGGQKAAGALIGHLVIHDGTVRQAAAKGTPLALEGVELELQDVRRDDQGRLQAKGGIDAKRLQLGNMALSALHGKVSTEKAKLRLAPLTFRAFDSDFEGTLAVEPLATEPVWSLQLNAKQLSLTELFRRLAGRPVFAGTVQLSTDLSWHGPGRFRQTVAGTLEASGTDLVQHGFALDPLIAQLRQARNVNLVDIAGYVFAGPVGALLSKGVDMAQMAWATQTGDQQQIERLVFRWSIHDGIARTEDVALRTPENRLALKGDIDLSQERYAGMTLAVLNTDGCAELTEKISGPLAHPSVRKTSMLRTLAGSLVGVLETGWEIIDPRDCAPFYQGSVQPAGAP